MDLYKEIKQILRNVDIDTHKCQEFVDDVLQKERKFKNTKDLIIACILPSFCEELCLYSGNSKVGYTSIKREIPLQIYGTSFLSLQGITPKWIVSFNVFTTSTNFCAVAQSVSFDLLKKVISEMLYKRYRI